MPSAAKKRLRKERIIIRTFRKAYLEITNCCNLSCSFCPKTARPPRTLTPEEFKLLAGKIRPATEYLYLHLMGEPLLHPELDEILRIAGALGFRVNITTNGTLLGRWENVIISSPAVRKVSISLHSFEANEEGKPENYFGSCADFAGKAAAAGKLVGLRLWNLDGTKPGENALNDRILELLHRKFPGDWPENRSGQTIRERLFLEYGERFEWPDLEAPDHGASGFCMGLRDQIGVLSDGTVVPCCLDHEGDLALGNLFREELSDILESPRAVGIYEGFSQRKRLERLCRRCGYATRFG